MAALFFRFTLESFAVMAFGSSIGALSLETDEPVPFGSSNFASLWSEALTPCFDVQLLPLIMLKES